MICSKDSLVLSRCYFLVLAVHNVFTDLGLRHSMTLNRRTRGYGLRSGRAGGIGDLQRYGQCTETEVFSVVIGASNRDLIGSRRLATTESRKGLEGLSVLPRLPSLRAVYISTLSLVRTFFSYPTIECAQEDRN